MLHQKNRINVLQKKYKYINTHNRSKGTRKIKNKKETNWISEEENNGM